EGFKMLARFEFDLLTERAPKHHGFGTAERRRARNRKGLKITSVFARRLESCLLKLRGNVIGGKVDSLRRDSSSFAKIGGEKRDILPHALFGCRILRARPQTLDGQKPNQRQHDPTMPIRPHTCDPLSSLKKR